MKINYSLKSEKGCIYNGIFYFVANNYSWILGMNIKTHKINIVAVLPKEFGNVIGHYIIGGCYDKKIILIPRRGTKIIEYDMEKRKFWYIEIGEMGLHFDRFIDGRHIRFRSTVQIDNILWILPCACHHILRYDINTRNLADYTEWYNLLEKYNWKDVILFGFGKLVGETIVLPCYQTNSIVVFNVKTGKSSIINIGGSKNVFACVEYWNNNLWLVDNRNKEIIEWNYKKEFIENKYNFIDEFAQDEKFNLDRFKDFLISDLQSFGDKIVAIPSCGNMFFSIDTNNRLKCLVKKISGESYLHGCIVNDTLLCVSQNGNKAIFIERCGNEEILDLVISVETEFLNQWVIYENEYNLLRDYINYIVTK